MNGRVVSQLLARLYGVLAVAMLASAPWAWTDPDGRGAVGLGLAASVAVVLAATLILLGRGGGGTVRVRDALAVVTIGWTSAGLLGCIPFLYSGAIPHFHDAIFETVSGFTTTGSSILDRPADLPRALQFWRMTSHWLGGLGIVVLFVALFPQLGVGAKHLFKSEVPGPITEGLRPKVKQTAMMLWWIYVALTAIEALLLWLAGMTPFDAITHAMSNLATGGFSTNNNSVGGFDSPTIEWIVCAFMYLAGINFALHYAVLYGRPKRLLRDGEWRAFTSIVVVTLLFIATLLVLSRQGAAAEPMTALREATFQVLAISTTTGFGTADYQAWPFACQVAIAGLMIVGGSAGSTSGGMKMSRLVIVAKAALIELAHHARPHTVRAVKIGTSPIQSDVIRKVFGYCTIFGVTVFVGAVVLALQGVDLATSFTATLTCVSNVGPAFGSVGPTDTFSHLPANGKVVLAGMMLLGRLEFFTVLALLLPSTWKQ